MVFSINKCFIEGNFQKKSQISYLAALSLHSRIRKADPSSDLQFKKYVNVNNCVSAIEWYKKLRGIMNLWFLISVVISNIFMKFLSLGKYSNSKFTFRSSNTLRRVSKDGNTHTLTSTISTTFIFWIFNTWNVLFLFSQHFSNPNWANLISQFYKYLFFDH